MTWIFLALFCALLVGSGDVLSKIALRKADEQIVGLARLLYSLPVLWMIAWQRGSTSGSFSFWCVLFGMLPFELCAYLLYLRAIRIAPLSLTIPFLALTPVFTIVTSWILLGEKVSRGGALGIFTITVGVYLIHLHTLSEGWAAPFRALLRERGTRLILISAFLYSITANLGKRAIQLSDPASFAFLYQGLSAVALSGVVCWKNSGFRNLTGNLLGQWRVYVLLGGVMALANWVHAVGIAHSPVPYFIAIKRTSLLVGVLYGGVLLKEERIPERLLGAGCMVLGVVLIALFP